MKIADRLTNPGGNFALYWTDLNYENLVVDAAGKVTVVDAENIVVVDRKAVHKGTQFFKTGGRLLLIPYK